MEPADVDGAGSVRWRLRKRVSVPVGNDGGDERDGHPPGEATLMKVTEVSKEINSVPICVSANDSQVLRYVRKGNKN